jgi:release factor glutamine methyltransferase
MRIAADLESSTDVATTVRAAVTRLTAAGSATPRLDAELLLGHVLERERAWILAHPDEPIGADASDRFTALLDRRAVGEPIAYLRGHRDWRSLRVRTDARALVPRPETETLVDLAVADIARRLVADVRPLVGWDVGTGSGAVAVALALRFREAIALGRLRLVASDRSPQALELAAENLEVAGVAHLVDLACADLLEPAGVTLPRPDVVVANLPYVRTAELHAAGPWLAHEPRLALDGGADGLAVIRRLIATAADHAVPDASLLLEVGSDQAAAVAALAAPRIASVHRDLAGRDRVVVLRDPSIG